MTEMPLEGAWNDDRIAAAFVARDRWRPLASTLVSPTFDRLREPPMRFRAAWLRPAVALAATLLIAVVAVFGSFSYASHRLIRPSPATTGGPRSSVTAAPSTPTSMPSDRAGTVLGLPIISVADAIAVRDAGIEDRELAVRGWYTPTTIAIFGCPIILHQVLPVQLGCGDQFVWLTQDREAIQRTVGGTTEFVPPKGPAIHPSFDELGGMWPTFALRLCGPSCAPHPTSIVAIGHFDDRRASFCDANVRSQCQDRFVVDRVDSVEGRRLDLNVADTRGGDRVWTLDDIDRLDPLEPTDGRLSIQVVNGRDKSLGIEPTLASDPAWSKRSAVWLVRDLVGGRLVTRVIADGASQVFELRSDGTLASHIDCRDRFCQFPAPTASPS